MRPQRPTVVLVLAILHLIGGGFGLIVVLCSGVGLLTLGAMSGGAGGAGGQAPPGSSVHMQMYLAQNAAGYMPEQIVYMVLGLILAMLLLMCGVGLLMMQPWARYLSFVYAALSIFRAVGNIAYTLFVLWPVTDKYIETHLAPNMPPGAGVGGKMGFFGGVAFQVAFILYPILVVVLLLIPSVAQAFARGRALRREGPEDEDEGWGGAAARDREDRGIDERGPPRRPRDGEDEEGYYGRR